MGALLWHAHDSARPAPNFNPTPAAGRLRPVRDATGAVVATLYAGDDRDTAIAEGPLHDVSRRLPRSVPYAAVRRYAITPLAPRRALRLVQLQGPGLARLGLEPRLLTQTTRTDYPATAAWSQALHDHPSAPDGLLWTSRLNDPHAAVLLFGDRVAPADLRAAAPPLRLDTSAGLDVLLAFAERADVRVDLP